MPNLLVPSTMLSMHLEKMASNVSVTWPFCWKKTRETSERDVELDFFFSYTGHASDGMSTGVKNMWNKNTSIWSCLESTNGPNCREIETRLNQTHSGVMSHDTWIKDKAVPACRRQVDPWQSRLLGRGGGQRSGCPKACKDHRPPGPSQALLW